MINFEKIASSGETDTLDKLAADVVELLKKKGRRIAFAESCTGGLLSELLTSVPGASEVYELGACTYSNRIKHMLLGVSEDTLSAHGAVSPETALEMARGMKRLSGADIAVSVTGIAGPGGGTPEKPVGTVYIAVCSDVEYVALLRLSELCDRSRESIRRNTALCVFKKVKELLI